MSIAYLFLLLSLILLYWTICNCIIQFFSIDLIRINDKTLCLPDTKAFSRINRTQNEHFGIIFCFPSPVAFLELESWLLCIGSILGLSLRNIFLNDRWMKWNWKWFHSLIFINSPLLRTWIADFTCLLSWKMGVREAGLIHPLLSYNEASDNSETYLHLLI